MAQLKIDVVVDDHGAAAKLQGIESSIKGVESGAVASASAVQKHSSAMSTWSASATSFLKQAGAMYVALGADRLVGALAELVSESLKSADAISNLSAKSGLSATTLQKLSYVGAAAGVSMETFATAAYRLQVRLGEGKDKGLLRAVDELGLNFKALIASSPDKQMNDVLLALSKIPDEQRRNQLGNELFGKSFATMAASVNSDYAKMIEAAHAASDEQIAGLDRLGDAWTAWVANRKSDITSFLGSLVLSAQNRGFLGFLQNIGARLHGTGLDVSSLESSAPTLTPQQLAMDAAFAAKFAEQNPTKRVKTQAELDAEERAAAARAREAKAEAARMQAEYDKLSGVEAINAAEHMTAQFERMRKDGIKPATKDLESFNKVLGEALDAMLRSGGTLGPAFNQTFNDWVRTLPVDATVGLGGKMPGTAVTPPSATPYYGNLLPTPGGVPGQLPGTFVAGGNNLLPPQPGFLSQAFGTTKNFGANLSNVIMQALTGGGNVGSSIGGFLGGGLFGGKDGSGGLAKMVSGMFGDKGFSGMIGGALSSVLPGLGTMLGSLVGPLFDKMFGPTEYEKRTRAEEDQRNELQKSLDMKDLQNQADFTGRSDLLQGITGGFSSNNDPEYIRGLVTELNEKTQQLEAAMSRYGISWEQLGEKARQSQINIMAEQFVQDFYVLTSAGADANFVIEKMGTSINEFVQTSLRTGTEIPIAMQPMLQRMVDMGTLVDANGVKLQDLSSITFAESMTAGFDKVANAVNNLASALGFKLPQAAKTATDGINAEFSRIRVPSFGFADNVAAAQEDLQDSAPQAALGGYVPARSGGTLVNVGEGGQGEYIVPESQMRGGLTVNVTVNGDVMSDGDVGEIVGQKVFEAVLLNKGGLYQRAQAALGNA